MAECRIPGEHGAAIRLDGVSKQFLRGERFDTMRDCLPWLARRISTGRTASSTHDRAFWALKDVSFELDRGEVLGVIGHNGAGKSTLLKILSGVMEPTAGQLSVRGRLSALIEVGAGFHPDLTGRENIFLNGAILGMRRTEIRDKFDEIVEFSGLGEFLDTPVKRYSTGMYARLGFSVAAHVSPDILIVDEVLSVGDYAFQNRCMERMRKVVKGGAAVIFVSHNLHAVSELCTRAILLDHGVVRCSGSVQDVVSNYLDGTGDSRQSKEDAEVSVANVVLRGCNGPQTRYSPGEKAWLDLDIVANGPCERLALVIYLRDGRGQLVFDTSTERLGMPAISLHAGQRYQLTVELTLHLANGAFHLGSHLYRYDIERMYEDRFPLATIFMVSNRDVRGAANLYPEIRPRLDPIADD